MKSKGVLLVTVVVTGLIVVLFFIFIGKGKEKASPISSSPKEGAVDQEPTLTPKVKILTWDDQAGFTFKYSEDLKIDSNPNDLVNYSNLDLSFANDVSGGIKVLAKDSIYKLLSDWIKKDKTLKDGNIIDTTLGGKDAKKIVFSDSGKEIIGTIDDNILFTVEVDYGTDKTLKGKWLEAFSQIVDSFEFVYPTPAASGRSSESINTSGEDVVEEEEIIE